MSEFRRATLLITGGTGSFGAAVLKHFLETDIGQIRIFSRDEKKQDDMRWSWYVSHSTMGLQATCSSKKRPRLQTETWQKEFRNFLEIPVHM